MKLAPDHHARPTRLHGGAPEPAPYAAELTDRPSATTAGALGTKGANTMSKALDQKPRELLDVLWERYINATKAANKASEAFTKELVRAKPCSE